MSAVRSELAKMLMPWRYDTWGQRILGSSRLLLLAAVAANLFLPASSMAAFVALTVTFTVILGALTIVEDRKTHKRIVKTMADVQLLQEVMNGQRRADDLPPELQEDMQITWARCNLGMKDGS